MISFTHVVAKDKGPHGPVFLRRVSLELREGIAVVAGTPNDGTSLLFKVAAAAARVRSGAVTIYGCRPERARRDVAYLPLDVVLPEGRVDQICALACRIRREPVRPAEEVLAPLHLTQLARRKTSSLSAVQARSVALALALSSKARVLLLEEPFTGLDPAAYPHLESLLRERARASTILIATSSVHDALRFADHAFVLGNGEIRSLEGAPTERAHMACSRITVGQGFATLFAKLSASNDITRVEGGTFESSESPTKASLTVYGRTSLDVARAITLAVAESSADIESLEPETTPLDTLRMQLAIRPARAAS